MRLELQKERKTDLLAFISRLLLLLMLTSCGYRFGEGALGTSNATITVPIVEGDKDGTLTSSIVNELSCRTSFSYRNTDARYILYVKVIDLDDLNIGFSYDRNRKGKRIDTLVPIESRLVIQAEVALWDSSAQSYALGPVYLKEFVDFDHDYYNLARRINIFSLGQVNDFDAAVDVAVRPLSKRLARKIVDYLIEGW